jgi:phosphodiesterase/alkaline phosphatase D-like protein
MTAFFAQLAMVAIVGSLLSPSSTLAQILPPATKAARVRITQGPELESAWDNWAIIRWKSNNPGGSDEHDGVVHYGTDPKKLSQTAKSHIRLNQTHSYTIFRVRVNGLTPRTKYYYTVDSMDANGTSDGVKSPVKHFTTAAPGQRIAADPPPK